MAIDASGPATKLRLVFEGGLVLGPGKIDLLEAIRDTGSISAAARQTNISYRKTRHLIDALNTAFSQPLVRSSKGGASHGGAHLTALGQELVARYRHVEQQTICAVTAHFGDFDSGVADTSEHAE
ncbi:winged helix-turn-helix domain-containing protein [Kushneria indalinina]|uniref:Molybdate transport system regulatory protein n=1 Tax=Kushneria indalinina DSM 14324 TaxID=1122140 RepID=A0A3D9DXI1_9GAMM|nr:winged helix-turn-helix domain-containing protein [Kushneria indalinina]REC95490.1 molybdate transport system regulatory protein [Kushneria indalinina DSM 14324]